MADPNITIDEQIREVFRELAVRRNVYTKRGTVQMTLQQQTQYHTLGAVLETLQKVKNQQNEENSLFRGQ